TRQSGSEIEMEIDLDEALSLVDMPLTENLQKKRSFIWVWKCVTSSCRRVMKVKPSSCREEQDFEFSNCFSEQGSQSHAADELFYKGHLLPSNLRSIIQLENCVTSHVIAAAATSHREETSPKRTKGWRILWPIASGCKDGDDGVLSVHYRKNTHISYLVPSSVVHYKTPEHNMLVRRH
ncbi:hypothetical protein KI387_029481, partial [Taxus chinensis]